MLQRVLAGGVELECFLDERSAFGIQRNGVDQVAVHVFAHIEITKFCFPDRATVFGLVTHLELDVFTGELVLHLVHDVCKGFHRVGVDAFAEVFANRDELDPHVIEGAAGNSCVGEVAEGT
nr:hypothetical protein [Glutamicibacter arilaitensis]